VADPARVLTALDDDEEIVSSMFLEAGTAVAPRGGGLTDPKGSRRGVGGGGFGRRIIA